MNIAASLSASLRPEALGAPPSGIVEVFRHGFGRPGIIGLWAGEGDLPTPDFICEAAARSMAAGETFYTNNAGLPELRAAIAAYHDRLYGSLFGQPFQPERFLVTASGMHAIQLAVTMLAGPGDEVIVPTPAWPNFAAAAEIRGARAVQIPLDYSPNGWRLDVDRLAAAITPATRAIFINSPSNPSGWTADRATIAALLDLSRRTGVWIVADEIYGRFHFAAGAPLAPSFHEILEPDDRVIFVNTFSKNWAMTGWRIGWIELPPSLAETAVNLIQYSSSGVPTFGQRAAIAALEEGEAFVEAQIARARAGLDIAVQGLSGVEGISFAPPAGAFYLFFRVDGIENTRRAALDIVDEANVGLAPGTAFGAAGNPFIRICFARSADSLGEAVGRMAGWFSSRSKVI